MLGSLNALFTLKKIKNVFIAILLFFVSNHLYANQSLSASQVSKIKDLTERYAIPYIGNKDAKNKIYFVASLASCSTCAVQLKELEKITKQNRNTVTYIIHIVDYSFLDKVRPTGYNDIAKANYAIWSVNKEHYLATFKHISEITSNTKLKDFDIFEELRNIPELAFKKQEVRKLDVDRIKLYAHSSRSDAIMARSEEIFKEISLYAMPSIIINGYLYSEPMFAEDIENKLK